MKKYSTVPFSFDSRDTVKTRINPKHATISKNRLKKNLLPEKGSFLSILRYIFRWFVFVRALGACVLLLNWKLVITCGQTTVNDEDCACCETGFIGGEEQRGVCDVNRLSDPP